MRTLLYFAILLIAFAACRKRSSYTDPSGARTTFAASMNEKRIWMGELYNGSTSDTDAFTQISVTVLNDRTIVIPNDTFKYVEYDANSQKILYRYKDYTLVKNLYFNTADNSMELEWSGKNTAGQLTTKTYHYNSSLKDYTPYIAGPKTLSGTVNDWFVIRNPPDSNYTVNTTINFKAINESTIVADKCFLDIYIDTLHYKLTDDATHTVVFQSFHTYPDFSTLTYNYDTKAIVFEETVNDFGRNRHLKLQ